MATRSIIGPGFDEWVQKQISVRQSTNKLGIRDRHQLIYQDANTAFLRLTSGINIATGFDDTNTPTGYDNGVEAKTYQLFNTRFNNEFAAGIGIGALNSAYGFQSSANYGFAPPPGLVSADVKSLNRGALREATINLLCHSATQFEIIDQLYLRLGYSMLLEWGWSTYYDNDGNFQNATTQVNVVNKFLTTGTTQEDLLKEIQTQRSGSNGNYDAMFGLVKNFSWNLEKDGSYNITLNLVSVGDVLESLKGNVSHPASSQTIQAPPEDEPPLQYNADKSTLNRIMFYLSQQLPPNNISINGGWNSYLQGNQTTADIIGGLIGLTPNQKHDRPNSQGDVIAFIFPQLIGVQGTTSGYNAQYYMKLGLLLRCLQNFCLLYDTSKPDDGNGSNVSPLFNINFEEEENFMFTFPRHGSLDPRVCLIDVLQDLTGTVGNQNPNTQSYTGKINEYKWYTINIVPDVYYNNNIPVEGIEELLNAQEVTPDVPTQTILANYFNFSGTVVPPGNFTANNNEAIQFADKINSLVNTYTPTAGIIKKQEAASTISLNAASTFVYTNDNMAWLQSSNQDPLAATLNKFTNDADISNFESEVTDVIYSGDYKGPYEWVIGEAKEAIIPNSNTLASSKIIKSERFSTVDVASGGRNLNFNYTLNIKEYTIQTVTVVKTSTGYTETTQNVEAPLDTNNNLFNNIRPGINYRVDKDNYPFIGRTMNMYVNMNFVAKTLEQFIDARSGAISMYDFLDKLMTGIQQALGNVNNFSVSYDDVTNTFSIIDGTFIPGLDLYKPEAFKNKPVEFITHTLDSTAGSFVRDATVKTQLSNNFATQVTVGAQANGNVVGENATALSKWNVGLADRIILEKSSKNNGQGSTTSDVDQKFYVNVGLVQNLYTAINDGNITDQQIDGSRDAAVDLFKYETGLYTKEGYIPGIGFIPINVELTMDGLSGMRIYESYTADTRLLPPKYKDAIQFIITAVSHRIQNNDWTTTISSISGPKYTGKGSVKTLPAIKTHSLKTPPKKSDTINNGNNNEFPIGDGNAKSNGTPSNEHERIILEAMRAAFSKGQTKGNCARGTGTMAINVSNLLKGEKAREMRKGDSGGESAKDPAHHNKLVSLGWSKYTYTGLTKAQAIDLVQNGPKDSNGNRIPWVAGDAVMYWNTDGVGENFHSQYYQNKLYTNYNWATDNDNNYKTDFVYKSKKANQWTVVVLKIPILG